MTRRSRGAGLSARASASKSRHDRRRSVAALVSPAYFPRIFASSWSGGNLEAHVPLGLQACLPTVTPSQNYFIVLKPDSPCHPRHGPREAAHRSHHRVDAGGAPRPGHPRGPTWVGVQTRRNWRGPTRRHPVRQWNFDRASPKPTVRTVARPYEASPLVNRSSQV